MSATVMWTPKNTGRESLTAAILSRGGRPRQVLLPARFGASHTAGLRLLATRGTTPPRSHLPAPTPHRPLPPHAPSTRYLSPAAFGALRPYRAPVVRPRPAQPRPPPTARPRG